MRYKLEQALGLLSEVLAQARELDPGAGNRLETARGEVVALLQTGSNGLRFWSWLDKQQPRADGVGKLARVAAKDKRWPRNGKDSLASCVERLERVNLSQGGPVWEGK